MKIESYSLGPIMTNAYLLFDDQTQRGVVIDPGQNPDILLQRIQELKLSIDAILLTHAHFDHIGGVEEVRKLFRADVYIHELEEEWLVNPELNGSGLWPGIPSISCKAAEKTLTGDQTLQLMDKSFQVIYTPGHSPGSVTYIVGEKVFSGDVLFQNSIGRTDLPGGDYKTLDKTLKKHFLPMPEDTMIYPGHGPKTSMGLEKANNPFLR